MPIDDRYRNLEFTEATEYLRGKINLDTDKWDDILASEHDAAFVVAGAKGSLLSDLRGAVDRAIASGQRPEDFLKDFERIAEGWAHSGDKAWRSNIILQTNLAQSYAAGRVTYQLDPEVLKVQPFLQWVHSNSGRPRPTHKALDGRIFRANELPFYPPHGFGCFPAGEKIATPLGWREIQTLQAGDVVIGGSGDVKPILQVHERPFQGELIQINIGDRKCAATPNHRFLTLRGWIKAENIKIGDVLVQVPNVLALDVAIMDINQLNACAQDGAVTMPVNPPTALQGHGLTPIASQTEPIQQFEQGSISTSPSFTKFNRAHTLLDIEDPEGFLDRTPFGFFDSADRFFDFAKTHTALATVASVDRVYYEGAVYNLTIPNDEAYCTTVAIVHNCLCRTISRTQGQVAGQEISNLQLGDTIPYTDDRGNQREAVISLDKGFGRIPGQADRRTILNQMIARMPGSVAAPLREELARIDAEMAARKKAEAAAKKQAKTKATKPKAEPKPKVEPKPKAEPKPKTEPKPKGETNTVLSRDEAAKQYKLLGSGIEGEVYLDDTGPTKRAIKYFDHPNDAEALERVRIAGEKGFGPKVFSISEDRKTLVMEFLDGFTPGIHPDDDDLVDVAPYNRSFVQMLKKAHDSGWVIGDLHEDNVMVNAATAEIRFVDQGWMKQGTWQAKADQLLNSRGYRPLSADVVKMHVGELGDRKAVRALENLRKKFSQGTGEYATAKPLTEAEYQVMVEETYKLLKL